MKEFFCIQFQKYLKIRYSTSEQQKINTILFQNKHYFEHQISAVFFTIQYLITESKI